MTPLEKRERLFKRGRPFIRELVIYDGDRYHKDLGILWAAHQKQPFYMIPENVSQQQFALEVVELSKRAELFMAEDDNYGYQGRGPIGLVMSQSDGWRVEPHVEFFPWATKRNMLSATVAFIQYLRYSRKVGVCIIRSLEDSVSLFRKCETYGVLHYVGKVHGGDPRGDEYLFSVKGKKK